MTTQPASSTRKQPQKSRIVLISIWLFVIALLGGLAAIFTPAVASLAMIVGLVAVGLSVLSLREDV